MTSDTTENKWGLEYPSGGYITIWYNTVRESLSEKMIFEQTPIKGKHLHGELGEDLSRQKEQQVQRPWGGSEQGILKEEQGGHCGW